MHRAKYGSRGFTLVASLLLLTLLSGFALGLLMMVNTEQRVGGNDLQNNYASRAAEGAIEKMTSDLGAMFKTIQAPQASQICALSGQYPTWDTSVTYTLYNVAPISGCSAALTAVYGPIQAGPNAGLYAQIIPVTLNTAAQMGTGETVSMTRTVEVALIPVFQFGVFSDADLYFGSSPDLTFAGRVHTNGDLYLGVATGSTLTFYDKLSAWGNVVRNITQNGLDATAGANNDAGTVDIPTASNGCTPPAAAACQPIAMNQGSVVNGPTSGQNNTWQNTSKSLFNSYLIDGNYGGANATGATNLALPFVNGTTQPFQIIRRPPPIEAAGTILGSSREGNMAQIRVMLSDTQNALHLSDWNGDPSQDIELASLVPTTLLAGGSGWAQNGIVVGANTYYFGEAWCGTPNASRVCNKDINYLQPPFFHGVAFPASGTFNGAPGTANVAEWPMVDGWLLVEAKWNDGAWHGVTKEWLGLGFARGLNVPAAPGTNAFTNGNTDHKNAILYFQQQSDRNGDGSVTAALDAAGNNINTTGAGSQYNWYPINFYDSREGEVWDAPPTTFTQGTGTPNGIMNAVELDVGNLKRWLAGTTGLTGANVNYSTYNGYILFFSDRRGMQFAADPTQLQWGEYGFEDTINYVNAGNNFAPNGALEPIQPGKKVSPEDVNGNAKLDNYGVLGVGDAFGAQTQADTDATNPPTPYAPNHRVPLFTYGRANRVTGARHALKLVDGSLGNLPTMPAASGCTQSAANPTGCGGFTVASENPVYILGNYNSAAPPADPTWTNAAAAEPVHAAAAVIADAVTLLSNTWQDEGACTAGSVAAGVCPAAKVTVFGSLVTPLVTNAGVTGQTAVTTYYRVAIAAGKPMAFINLNSNPTWAFGIDGGVHNFLRFLEDWTGQNLYYKGSMVNLYWNTYATGTFKCCNLVYHPPIRDYVFDPLFAQPQNLPPGTPLFRNVDNLTYRQNFIARTN
jgi:hypothetical protein